MNLQKYKLISDSTSFTSYWTKPGRWQTIYHNELRITQKGKPKHYISDALQFFNEGSKKVTLRAIGRVISKAIIIAEVLKRKLALHQCTYLSSFTVVDVYEPLEEGLDRVENIKWISCVEILLSLNTDDVDMTDLGYQPPLHHEQNPSLLSSDFNSMLEKKESH